MIKRLILAAPFILCGNLACADTQAMHDAARGALLYSTHCIACHTTEIHWREKKLATDWTSLHAQVYRWQENTGLGWSEEDVSQVVRYLNANFYHYSTPD